MTQHLQLKKLCMTISELFLVAKMARSDYGASTANPWESRLKDTMARS